MDKIGEISTLTFELFGRVISINQNMLIMTYVVIALLVGISILATPENFDQYPVHYKI